MASKRPNFLVIVADDLGFSDLGCFGGESQTPNLDRIAMGAAGIRMTNFHTASMCSPTRAMLLSGTDHHIAGVGQMAFWGSRMDPPPPWKSRPGYEGYLNHRVAALSEVMQDAGYYTCMSGKWHLGLREGLIPKSRGFDRSFSLLPGAAPHYNFEPKQADGSPVFKHWSPLYYEDDKEVKTSELPEGFYSSDYFATRLMEFFDERKADKDDAEKPFFAFLPFTAPHWPLHAPQETIRKYRGMYDEGPDALRERRLKKQMELGLLPEGVEAHPPTTDMKEWEDMTPEEKAWSARTMEVFSGMVDKMDENIGRVLDYLKDSGELDNTFVLFMSDNGAEGAIFESIPMTDGVIKKSIGNHFNNDVDNIGNHDSFIWYGPRWALAATAPSRMYKGFVTEGGIRCPAIIHYPPFAKASPSSSSSSSHATGGGRITDAFTTVMDIFPTVLDLAGVDPPGDTFRGREVVPLRGSSWTAHLGGSSERVHAEDHVTGWELFFHQAIRKDKWKAVFIPKPDGPERWQLYDLESDMGEVHDLAEKHPEILDELVKYWLAYVSEFGVFLKDELDEDFVLPPVA